MSVAALVSLNNDLNLFNNLCREHTHSQLIDNTMHRSDVGFELLEEQVKLGEFDQKPGFTQPLDSQYSNSSSSFSQNIDIISRKYQNVPREVIASVLEDVSNNVSKAVNLIQQMTETLPRCKRKRNERDWGDMIDDQCIKAKRLQLPCYSPTHIKDDSPDDDVSSSLSKKDTFDYPHQESEGSTGCSSFYLDHAPHLHPSEHKTNDDTSNRIVKILTRMVLSQNEKLRSSQQRCSELEVQLDQLKLKLEASEDQAQRYKQLNTTLQYFVTTSNQASTDEYSKCYDGKHVNHDVY